MNQPLYWLLPPFVLFFPTPNTVLVFVTLFFSKCMTELHLLNLATLVTEAHFFVFYSKRRQVYCRFGTDYITFARTLI